MTAQIIELSPENIRESLIQNSMQKPVVLEIYATSLPESVTLSPILAELSAEFQFTLLRLNAEVMGAIAQQLGVRQVPEVHVWEQGKVVDGFNGTLTKPEIANILSPFFVSQDDLLASQAHEMYKQGLFQEAAIQYGELLRKNPERTDWLVEQARCLLGMNDSDTALQILQGIKEPMDGWRDAQALIQLMQFHTQYPLLAENTPLEKMYKDGVALVLNSEYEGAMRLFLEVVKADRSFKDDAGRTALLCLFQVLGSHPEQSALVRKFRQLLSMHLFS